MRSVPLRLWALALLSAFLQAMPFPLAGPVPAWRRFFCWFCLVPLLFSLTRVAQNGKLLSLKQGLGLGYLCGVVWYLLNCYWIYATMHRYGGLPEAAASGVLLLFALYLGLYHALFGGLVVLLRSRLGEQPTLLAAPFLWTAVELARSRITGFPWDLLGYTQIDHAGLSSMAATTGVMGLSFLVACINSLWLFRPARAGQWARYSGSIAALTLVVVITMTGLTHHGSEEAGTRTAVLLQDNLSVGAERGPAPETQEALLANFVQWSLHPLKAGPLGADQTLSTYAPLRTPPDIIAWAEAPSNFWSADPDFRQAVGLLARQAYAPVIADTASREVSSENKQKEFASAAFFGSDGAYLGRYDKMHLVPFGEYVPYKPLFFFAGHLLDGLDFSPGSERRTLDSAGHRFGVFICYESVFGDEVRQFAQAGAQVFVNLSDDGWYGDTSAPWEHLDMVRMRAIENRRWVLRATNTGVTGSIDPEGRVVAALPRHLRAALAAPFSYRDDTTFYTRHGDWIGWLCVVISSGALGFAWLRRESLAHASKSSAIN